MYICVPTVARSDIHRHVDPQIVIYSDKHNPLFSVTACNPPPHIKMGREQRLFQLLCEQSIASIMPQTTEWKLATDAGQFKVRILRRLRLIKHFWQANPICMFPNTQRDGERKMRGRRRGRKRNHSLLNTISSHPSVMLTYGLIQLQSYWLKWCKNKAEERIFLAGFDSVFKLEKGFCLKEICCALFGAAWKDHFSNAMYTNTSKTPPDFSPAISNQTYTIRFPL